MAEYTRDHEHSWDEIDESINDLLEGSQSYLSSKDEKLIRGAIHEHLVMREICFLADRCWEMDEKSRLWFAKFLWNNLNGWVKRERVPRVVHRLYIASLVFPLLSKTDSNYGQGDSLIATAMKHLDSCRLRYLSSDFIRESDLPWMRGELLELVMESMLTRGTGNSSLRSGNNEYCAWLGDHVDEAIAVVLERRSMDPELIRNLVDSGNPLNAGSL